jgi:type I restriction enzyme M protein
VAAHEWLVASKNQGGAGAAAMERDVALRVRRKTYFGQDLVSRPRRLALMRVSTYEIPAAPDFR